MVEENPIVSKLKNIIMKKIVLSLAIIALMFAGCGEKKSNNHAHEGEDAHDHAAKTHQHDDGTVHEEHHNPEHQQEEFKVKIDSTSNNGENH